MCDVSISGPWLIHTCNMTATWLQHDCNMTRVIRRSVWRWKRRFILWCTQVPCVTRLIQLCDMTHSYVWNASRSRKLFILWCTQAPCLTWLVHFCNMTHSTLHDSSICAPWLIRMCNMAHSYVQHDSFICVTCLTVKEAMRSKMHAGTWCDMTDSILHYDVRHDSFNSVKWLIHMCEMPRGQADDSFVDAYRYFVW